MKSKSQLQQKFEKEVITNLMKEQGYKNRMAIPRLEKIVVNIGLGEALKNPNAIEKMTEDIALITGQRPIVRKSTKAISNFKIRIGDEIGLKVTLRKDNMWYFLEKFINIVTPRIKDFRGLPVNSFDGKGNYTVGIREHTVFPEINPANIDRIRSLQVIIVTTAKSDKEGKALLKNIGIPFKKEK